jgi:hypothetical protein
MMLLAAAMLVVGVGAPALWIGVVTVGIAVVVIERTRGTISRPSAAKARTAVIGAEEMMASDSGWRTETCSEEDARHADSR